MGRFSIEVATPLIMELFNLTKAQFGVVTSTGSNAYALGCLINGPTSERIGGRKAMLIGVLGSAIMFLLTGLFIHLGFATRIVLTLAIAYSLNQYFQSFCAVAVSKVNAAWFHVRERGVFGGIWNTVLASGYFMAWGIGGYVMHVFPWYFVFIVPALCMLVMWTIMFFLVRNKPSEAGYKDFDTGDASSADPDKDKPVDWGYLWRHVFLNKVIIILAITDFCVGVSRYGLLRWWGSYLKEIYHVVPGTALYWYASLGPTIGGVAGGLSIGYFSDKLFGSRRPPVACIFFLLQIVSMYLLVKAPSMSFAVVMILINCIWAFGIHGIVAGTCSMDFGGTKGVATVSGIFNAIHYVGASVSGVLLGYAIDKWGWFAWFSFISPFCAIGAFLMIILWNETPSKKCGSAAG